MRYPYVEWQFTFLRSNIRPAVRVAAAGPIAQPPGERVGSAHSQMDKDGQGLLHLTATVRPGGRAKVDLLSTTYQYIEGYSSRGGTGKTRTRAALRVAVSRVSGVRC
jgi:hypothetical protein